MLAALRTFSDRLLGRGSSALTVPPLDGALRPDNRLEEAPDSFPASAPDCLVLMDGRPVWSETNLIRSQTGEIARFGSPVTALSISPGGTLAAATTENGISIGGQSPSALESLGCVTALAFESNTALWIAIGSTANPIDQWPRDLLELRRSGQLLRFDLKTGDLKLVANGLAYPNGFLWTAEGVVVSEAWAARVVRYDMNGKATPLVTDLPGYPAGISRSAAGFYWLAVFAPRSPLVELVLREPAYRRAMMRNVDPRYWIAPALRSGESFFEPMQGGALKQMGILKPWAPTQSYGLVVQFGPDFTPVQSLHSRAGGRRHGVTSVLEHDGELWLTAKGGDEVLRIAMGDRP